MHKLLSCFVCLALFVCMAFTSPALAQKPSGPVLADLAEKLLPAVVNISSTQKMADAGAAPQNPFQGMPDFPEGSPFKDFFDEFKRQQGTGGDGMPSMPATSLGSGFIIDAAKGYVVTNYHVIKDADEIKITLHDDTVIPATLVGKDDKTDLAIIKADLKGQKVAQAPIGNSDLMRVGDPVFAIGNPFGLGGTVTAGIVSARARNINAGPYDDFIQTDASINRGNSGGPMFNMAGEVIGINTAIFSPSGGSVGIGFAIPSNLAKPVFDQLLKFGKTRRGWLGVKVQSVTDEIAKGLKLDKPRGALVASVSKTSPAGKVGIKPGDVILSLNGQPITDMRQLPRTVAGTDIGKAVPMTYWRGGAEKTVTVTLGELEKAEASGAIDDKPTATADKGGSDKVSELGISVAPLTPALRAQYHIGADIAGIVVTSIPANNFILRQVLSVGDVITEANQTPIRSVAEFKAQVAATKKSGSNTVLMLVSHGGEIQFIAVDLQPDAKK